MKKISLAVFTLLLAGFANPDSTTEAQRASADQEPCIFALERCGIWLWPTSTEDVITDLPEDAVFNNGSYNIAGGGSTTVAARATRIGVANTGPDTVVASVRVGGGAKFIFIPKNNALGMTHGGNLIRIWSAGNAMGNYVFF